MSRRSDRIHENAWPYHRHVRVSEYRDSAWLNFFRTTWVARCRSTAQSSVKYLAKCRLDRSSGLIT
jgi:hypothetical protein